MKLKISMKDKDLELEKLRLDNSHREEKQSILSQKQI